MPRHTAVAVFVAFLSASLPAFGLSHGPDVKAKSWEKCEDHKKLDLANASETDLMCAAYRGGADADFGDDFCDPHYADPSCTLLGDWFGKLLQLVLLLIGFGSLLMKKWAEEKKTGVKRDFKTWGMDVTKQGTSQICAHFAGILNASIMHSNEEFGGIQSDDARMGDKCSWYFLSFTMDTTLGVSFSFLMFTALTRLANKFGWQSLQKSGDYLDAGGRVDYIVWLKQLVVWCGITVVARFMVLAFLILNKDHFKSAAATIANTFACHPKLLLTLVMVGGPVCLNIVALWIQDQFLKAKTVPRAASAPPLDTPLLSLVESSAASSVSSAASSNSLSLSRFTPFSSGGPPKSYKEMQRQCVRKCCWVMNIGVLVGLLVVLG